MPTQRRLANAIRALAMDAVEAANSGHPGMPMGMADAATALFTRHLKHDPSQPNWPDRDRFVLSAGHGSMLIYALLHLTGYAARRSTIAQVSEARQPVRWASREFHARRGRDDHRRWGRARDRGRYGDRRRHLNASMATSWSITGPT